MLANPISLHQALIKWVCVCAGSGNSNVNNNDNAIEWNLLKNVTNCFCACSEADWSCSRQSEEERGGEDNWLRECANDKSWAKEIAKTCKRVGHTISIFIYSGIWREPIILLNWIQEPSTKRQEGARSNHKIDGIHHARHTHTHIHRHYAVYAQLFLLHVSIKFD